jgi:hypothetical protein
LFSISIGLLVKPVAIIFIVVITDLVISNEGLFRIERDRCPVWSLRFSEEAAASTLVSKRQ